MSGKILKEVRGRGETKRSKMTGAKLNQSELKAVDKLAAKFTKGSRAKWARLAMLKFRPTAEDFE